MKKQAKKEIRKLEKTISKLPNTPDSFVYVNLLHCLKQIDYQKNHSLVIAVCKNVRRSLSR